MVLARRGASTRKSKGCILVVEDHDDVRDMLADLLGHEGYQVSQAAHGQHALDLLHGGLLPNVILLDLNMPVLDGRAFLRLVRLDSVLARIPIILLTANEDGVPVDEVEAVLKKPADIDALLGLVERLCPAATG